jgi:hypothetical protein
LYHLSSRKKPLIDQTKHIIHNGKKIVQGKFCKQLIQPMRSRQQALYNLLIDWCLPMLFSGEKQIDILHASWQSDLCLAFTRIFLFHFVDIDGMFGAICLTQLNCAIKSSGFAFFPTCFAMWHSFQPIELTILSGCSCPTVKMSPNIQKKPVVIHSSLLNQTSSVCLIALPSSRSMGH